MAARPMFGDRVWRLLIPPLAASLAALVGCAHAPPEPEVSARDLAWVRAGADVAPREGGIPIEDPESLLRVSDAMRQFVESVTGNKYTLSEKTAAISAAIGGKKGLDLQYDSTATLTAEQAFTQRRANCLSYTLLLVALAREVGVSANFNEVEIPPIFDVGDDRLYLLYRHVNARIELSPPFALVVDISGDEYDPNYAQHVVPDSEALAQFYNNRAVELRLGRHTVDALRYELRALDLAPGSAFIWTNLAGLYLDDGSLEAARIAILYSLSLDSSMKLSYDTAAQIYGQLGDQVRAAHFRERARHFQEQNPYYHYQLALAALNKGDMSQSQGELERAIVLYPKDPRFHFLLAVVLKRQGEIKLAEDSLRAAIQLTTDSARQQRYQSKFARLSSQGQG